MTPISVQLYSLRDACADNFDHVLERVAAMGYEGVEPFNLFGKSPGEFRNQVENLGMRISSSHTPWANRTPIAEVIDTLGALGLNRAAGGFRPEDFSDSDALQRTIETTQHLIEQLKPAGIDLFLHNHWWEFNCINGIPAYHQLQEQVPGVQFEIDTYWAANFGACDPAAEVTRVRERTPLLHIKDGPLTKDEPHVAVGDGAMNIPNVINAADPHILEWLIVELDHCATDVFAAVAQSQRYLSNLSP